MFSFGRENQSALYGVIIDIGSGSVGVGILHSDHTKKLPEILFAHRVYMRVKKRNTDEDERLRQMREALFSASLILAKEGMQALANHDPKGKIGRILVTCSSPWAHTISRNVSYAQDEPIEITKKLIQDLVQTAEKEVAEQLEETALVGSLGLQVVERATVDVRVNGYIVHNPIGLEGKTVELSHITGLLPEEILEAIYEVQEKILTDTTISAHTYMLVVYCVLRDLFPKTDSLCIVDVTGETTEIGLVENGILLETIHAPYGSNTLLREVGELTGGTIEEAQSLLRTYAEGTSTKLQTEQIEQYLANFDAIISDSLSSVHANKNIPRTMVITALPRLAELFNKRIPYLAEKITDDSYTVLQLKDKTLNEIAEEQNQDTFISLASRFFHKLHGCGEIDTQ